MPADLLNQSKQPILRRSNGGIRANAVAGLVFALFLVVLMNVRPFSPWLPPETKLRFAAEILSPADGKLQVGKMIYGGMIALPGGRVALRKSDAHMTVFADVCAPDGGGMKFVTSLTSGLLEMRDPRIVDEQERVIKRLSMQGARAIGGGAVLDAGDGVLRVSLGAATEIAVPVQWDLAVPSKLWPGLGVVLAEFFTSAILFGAFCAFVSRRFPGFGAKAAAACAESAESRPKAALLCAAIAGVLVACHPVVFLGGSFVSPDNGCIALYHGYPSLPGGESVAVKKSAGSDLAATTWAFLPYSCIQHAALAQGEWPLRNRYAGCGLGLQGQGISMFGDPLHLIPVAANGEAWAWDTKFVLARLFFAWGVGLVAFAAVRRIGIAALLAVSASFIGHFAYRFNHPAHFTLCYAPWVLLPWIYAMRAVSFRDALKWMPLHVLASVAVFSSGALKQGVILLGTLNCTGLLALLLRPLPWRARLAPAAAMLAANTAFVLIAAPSWLTFLDLMRESRTVYDVPKVFQIQPPLFIGLFDDLFCRRLMRDGEHFDPSGNFLLLLGVMWSLVRARVLVREPLWLACAVLGACALSVAYGIVPPSWIAATPFLKNVWHVDNCFSLAALALSFVLAAFGLRECLGRRAEPEWRGDWGMFCAGILALCALYFGFTQASHGSGLSMHGTVAKEVSAEPFFKGYAAAIVVSVLALPLLWWKGACKGLGTGGWLAVAIALALIHFRHGYHAETKFDHYVRSPQPRPNIHAPSQAIEKIRASIAASGCPSRIVGTDMNLTPDFNAVYGIESPFGVDALMNRRQWELVEAAGFSRTLGWRVVVTKAEVAKFLPILDVFGVRHYVGTPRRVISDIPSLTPIALADMEVHESRTAWPRAFFTDLVTRSADASTFVNLARAAYPVPFAAAAPDVSLPAALESDASTFAKRTVVPATDYRLTANTTAFRINAPAPGVIVLGEAFEQGSYTVTVNGAKAEPFRVNHAFLGVRVDTDGPCNVVFIYRPRVWNLALTLAALGLVLTGIAGVWAIRLKSCS